MHNITFHARRTTASVNGTLLAKLQENNLVGCGRIAQLVEQRTENPCVAGSIPGLATTFSLANKGDIGALKKIPRLRGKFAIVSSFLQRFPTRVNICNRPSRKAK